MIIGIGRIYILDVAYSEHLYRYMNLLNFSNNAWNMSFVDQEAVAISELPRLLRAFPLNFGIGQRRRVP